MAGKQYEGRNRLTQSIRAGLVSAGVVIGVALAVGPETVSAATLVVDTTSGDATVAGSLPFQVAAAMDGDVITFDPTVFNAGAPQTITLDDTLFINRSVDVQGPGRDALTLTVADASDEVVRVASASDPTVEMSALTVTGSTDAGFFVSDTLVLDDVLVTGNAVGIDASSAGSISITNSDVDEQTGMGLKSIGATAITIEDSGFSTNVGRAIELSSPVSVTLESVTVDSDLTGDPAGQGITIISGTGPVDFTDVDVSGQDAGGSGFGMRFVNVSGAIDITDSSVTGSTQNSVTFEDVDSATISDSSFSANSRSGVVLQTSGSFEFTNVVTNGNGEAGIFATADSLTLTNHTANSTVNGPGLNLFNVGELVIDGGTFNSNQSTFGLGSQGIAMSGTEATISGATVSNNSGAGITSSNSDVTVDSTSVVTENGLHGIDHQNGGSLTINGSNVSDNGRDGVRAIDSTSVTVTGSQFERNDSNGASPASGISASDLAGPISVTSSRLSDNELDGLRLLDATDDVTVQGSTFELNTGSGIDVFGPTATAGDISITGGSVLDNGTTGIRVLNAADVTMTGVDVDSNFRSDGVGGAAASPAEGAGIDVRSVESFALDGGAIEDNGGIGVYVDANGPVVLDGARLTDNERHGAFVAGVTTFSSDGLTATDNGDDGIFVSEATSVTIESLTASGNDDDGVALNEPMGRAAITASSFTDQDGSGVAVFGGTAPVAVEVTDTIFDANLVGIQVTDSAALTVTDSEFENHTSDAISLNGATGDVTVNTSQFDANTDGVSTFDSTTDVRIVDSDFANTTDTAVEVVQNTGDLVFERSSITATNRGVVADDVDGAVRIDRSSLFRNGGASFADTLVRATDVADGLTIINSTFASNMTSSALIDTTGTDVRFAHSSLENSSAFTAINVDGDLTLDHSIVLIAGSGTSFESSGGTVTGDYSILEEGSGLGGTTIETFDSPSSFDDGNGGSDGALVPRFRSIAIDAGDPNITSAPATDQRGNARIVDVIDIGAIETDTVIPALVSLEPGRFADTRANGETIDDRFVADGKLTAGEEYRVDIAGRGDVPADAAGVVMNVTAVAAEGNGFVTVHPCVTPRPLSSSLNYTAGVNLGNEVIAGLSGLGEVCLFTFEAAHITVDVTGYIPDGSSTTPITPRRFLDTRPAGETFDGNDVAAGKTGNGGEVRLDVAGRGGVPADAAAVIVNVTAVGATDTGFVTVHPCVSPLPVASSLNFVAGVNRGNELIASLDATGDLCIFTSASIHLTADVVGYIPAGSTVTAVEPARLLDTRVGGTTVDDEAAGDGPLTAGEEITLNVAGRAGVPTDATAVVVNVTAIGAAGTGFATVHPCLTPTPLSSSLNYVQGVNGANEIIALLDADGDLCLFSFEASNFAIDVVGYLL